MVKDLAKAIKIYGEVLGIKEKMVEESAEFQVKIADIHRWEKFAQKLTDI